MFGYTKIIFGVSKPIDEYILQIPAPVTRPPGGNTPDPQAAGGPQNSGPQRDETRGQSTPCSRPGTPPWHTLGSEASEQ